MLARSSRRFKIRLRVADLFEAAIDFRDRDLQPSVRDSTATPSLTAYSRGSTGDLYPP